MALVILAIPLIAFAAWFVANQLGRRCAVRLQCSRRSAMKPLIVGGFLSMLAARIAVLREAELTEVILAGWSAFILGMIVLGTGILMGSCCMSVVRRLAR